MKYECKRSSGVLTPEFSSWFRNFNVNSKSFQQIIPFNTSVVVPRAPSSSRARPELDSPMNFARFYTPFLLRQRLGGSEIGRLVHLDDDVILQSDVVHLWNQTIDHKHWAAFSNDCRGQPKVRSRCDTSAGPSTADSLVLFCFLLFSIPCTRTFYLLTSTLPIPTFVSLKYRLKRVP